MTAFIVCPESDTLVNIPLLERDGVSRVRLNVCSMRNAGVLVVPTRVGFATDDTWLALNVVGLRDSLNQAAISCRQNHTDPLGLPRPHCGPQRFANSGLNCWSKRLPENDGT